MPHVQPKYEISDRDLKLYYFTVHEVAQMLRRSEDYVKKIFKGRMIWYDGRWNISPTDLREWRESE